MHPFMWFGFYVAGDVLRIPAAPEQNPDQRDFGGGLPPLSRYRIEVVRGYRATARAPPCKIYRFFTIKIA